MRLQKTQNELKPGRGVLELGAIGSGDLDSGKVAGRVAYEHRITKSITALAEGQAGYRYGDDRGAFWQALVSGRWNF